MAKLRKLAHLVRRKRYRTALWRTGAAAAVEHEGVLRFCAPTTVLDVGANRGQFSIAVRQTCPNALIHAFEPLNSAADQFGRLFSTDPAVTLHRVAIGAGSSEQSFHITDREDSSSLLQPAPGQQAAFGVAEKELTSVRVEPLEDMLDLSTLPPDIMLKIDVQGYELEVLKGISSYDRLTYIYVELSYVELYRGQALYPEVEAFLAEKGFTLRGVYNQAITEAFGPTQADFLFARPC